MDTRHFRLRSFSLDRKSKGRIRMDASRSSWALWVILLAIVGAGAVYMHMVSSTIGESYQLRERKEVFKDLQRQRERLLLKQSLSTSIRQLERRAETLELVEAGAVRYLAVPGTAVAVAPQSRNE